MDMEDGEIDIDADIKLDLDINDVNVGAQVTKKVA